MRKQPEDDPIGHLTSPIVTGGAVIALKCREGVLIATDTLLSYGGLLSIPPSMQSTTASTGSNRYRPKWLLLRLDSSLTSRKPPADSRNSPGKAPSSMMESNTQSISTPTTWQP